MAWHDRSRWIQDEALLVGTYSAVVPQPSLAQLQLGWCKPLRWMDVMDVVLSLGLGLGRERQEGILLVVWEWTIHPSISGSGASQGSHSGGFWRGSLSFKPRIATVIQLCMCPSICCRATCANR
ncbi:hypothetical protein FALCPG4_000288 [Fusarium falciforme]